MPDTGEGYKTSRPKNRRQFLTGIAALSAVGLAGCGDDGDTPTETATLTNTETGVPTATDTETRTPTSTDTGTETPTDTATEAPTDTATEAPPGIPEGEDPDPLLSFDGVLSISPGESTTISGTVENPYLFALSDGTVSIEPPGDDWSVEPAGGTEFSSLESGGEQSAEWEVTAPASGSGEATLAVTVSYATPAEAVDPSFDQPIYVVTPPDVSTSSVGLGDLGPTWKHAMVPRAGGPSDDPVFSLPEDGQPLKDGDENPVDDSDWSGPEDKSADVHLGYDADNFYLEVVATDDEHQSLSGGDMWQGDTVQFASASDDRSTYGPDYGLTRVDGSADTIQFRRGNATDGADAIDLQTSREGTTTTYDATIPWTAMFPEAPSAGDSFPFDVLVHERDGGNWIGALSWSDFSIYSPKFPEKEGTLTLESEGEDLPWEVRITSNPDADLGERGTWTVTVANYAGSSQNVTMTLEGADVERTFDVSANGAVRVDVTKTVLSEDPSGIGATLDNGQTTRTV